MKFNYLPVLLMITVSESSLAQCIERVCLPSPTIVSSIKCHISTHKDQLAIEINDESDAPAVMESIYNAMESYGFDELSDNIYWFPDSRTCYFSLYEVDSKNFVFVPGERRVAFEGVGHCVGQKRYDAASFGSIIEQAFTQDNLLSSVSIYFTNVRKGSEIYEKILESGGRPGLMLRDTGEIVSIDIQY